MTRTILIVDDAETCAATLELALATIPDVRVSLAATVAQALRLLRDERTPVGAVVTDLNMPGNMRRAVMGEPIGTRIDAGNP